MANPPDDDRAPTLPDPATASAIDEAAAALASEADALFEAEAREAAERPPRRPRATYRLQLHRGFRLEDVEADRPLPRRPRDQRRLLLALPGRAAGQHPRLRRLQPRRDQPRDRRRGVPRAARGGPGRPRDGPGGRRRAEPHGDHRRQPLLVRPPGERQEGPLGPLLRRRLGAGQGGAGGPGPAADPRRPVRQGPRGRPARRRPRRRELPPRLLRPPLPADPAVLRPDPLAAAGGPGRAVRGRRPEPPRIPERPGGDRQPAGPRGGRSRRRSTATSSRRR